MEARYAVLLEGRKIGTVRLDPGRRGTIVARLAPLPAWRPVAPLPRQAADGWEALVELLGREPPDAPAAGAEARRALRDLPLSLADDATGAPVPARSVRLRPGEPPRVAIEW